MRNFYEVEDDGNFSSEKIEYNLSITPLNVSIEDTEKAFDNIDNYGSYISSMRSTQAGLQKALEDHFGPSSPQTKKSLEKKRGFPFPIRTKQSIDDFIKSYQSKPNLVKFYTTDSSLVFPQKQNLNQRFTKSIIKTVLDNAGIKYKEEEIEISENVLKLKSIVKEILKNERYRSK
jgi:hypothetical protein